MLADLEKRAMEAVKLDNLMASVEEIAQYERLSGSLEELLAFQWIEKKMRGYGFKTSLTHVESLISLPKSASLQLVSPVTDDIVCITHSASVSTPAGGVEGEVVWVDKGNEIQGTDLSGKFVMLEGLAMPDAAVAASKAGALGQIHVSYDSHIHDMTIQNVWGNPDDQSISTMPKTHVVSIARADGERIRDLLKNGTVRVRVATSVESSWRPIPILECSLEGTDGTGDFLLFSGHVDSWYYGAMDNGSANATMIEVGRILAGMRESLVRGVKICFWSGHSHGRYSGSTWYADHHWEELNEHCIMHLNTDSTGGVGAVNLSRASIMGETRSIGAWAISEVMGLPFEGSRISRNGDQSFWGIGIPSMFVSVSQQVTGGLGWWWHNPADLPDKVDAENLVRDTKVYALVASRLLTSAVLPFDYAATMDEWAGAIAEAQKAVGKRFDLSPVMERAQSLKEALKQLQSRELSCACCAGIVNDCLLELGRELIPVAYTTAGRYHQDPATRTYFLPDIHEVVSLAGTGVGSDEEKLLKVRLVRGVNRVNHALSRALKSVREAITRLD